MRQHDLHRDSQISYTALFVLRGCVIKHMKILGSFSGLQDLWSASVVPPPLSSSLPLLTQSLLVGHTLSLLKPCVWTLDTGKEERAGIQLVLSISKFYIRE